jgi:hypothetical protein
MPSVWREGARPDARGLRLLWTTYGIPASLRGLRVGALRTRYRSPMSDDYCGCCGHWTEGNDLWCARCQAHVGTVGAPWDRTHYARFGVDCPYQVPGKRL